MPNNCFSITEAAYRYFTEISAIPRGSGNEAAISRYLTDEGRRLSLDVTRDSADNVLIRRPGRSGFGLPVILQAHMDMVCDKTYGSSHDFLKDAIVPVIDGDWIKSGNGTTLGADNGGGAAIILAVLASDTQAPPIEALFTAKEETGMDGAAAFDTSLLRGRRFINLDSEETGVLTKGCAGSVDIEINVPLEYEPVPGGYAFGEIRVCGLKGGHSGIDINKGRANAIFLLFALLGELSPLSVRACGIRGGKRRNIIAREASVVIAYPLNEKETILEAVAGFKARIAGLYPSENEFCVSFGDAAQRSVYTRDTLQKVCGVIENAPQGVIALSPHTEGGVLCSSNAGVAEEKENVLRLLYLARSMEETRLTAIAGDYSRIAREHGAVCVTGEQTPVWEYLETSPLCDIIASVYEAVSGKKIITEAVHAGLEPAVFARRMPPGTEFAAIGPTIYDAHTPRERMSLSSFNETCLFLIRILEALSKGA